MIVFVHTLLTLQCTFIKEIVQIEESVSRGQVLNETLRDRKATDYNRRFVGCSVLMAEQCFYLECEDFEDSADGRKSAEDSSFCARSDFSELSVLAEAAAVTAAAAFRGWEKQPGNSRERGPCNVLHCDLLRLD